MEMGTAFRDQSEKKKYIATFRDEATSDKVVFIQVLYPGRIGIRKCWSQKTGEPGEKPPEQGKNRQQIEIS